MRCCDDHRMPIENDRAQMRVCILGRMSLSVTLSVVTLASVVACASSTSNDKSAGQVSTESQAPSVDGLEPGTAVVRITGGDETPATWNLRQNGGMAYDSKSPEYYYISFLDDPSRPARDSEHEQYLSIGLDNEKQRATGRMDGNLTISIPPSKYYKSELGGSCTIEIISIDDVARRGTFSCSGLGGVDRNTGQPNGKKVDAEGVFAYKRTRS
jgi:hypothetical protein